MVVDELARRHGGAFKGKFSGRLADVRLGDARLALLKPETYMNESGTSIQAAAWGGRVVTCGATSGHDAPTDLRHDYYRQVAILGST